MYVYMHMYVYVEYLYRTFELNVNFAHMINSPLSSIHTAVGVNVFPLSNPIDLSFEGNETNSTTFRAEFMVEVRKDGVFSGTGNLQFQLSLRNTMEGAVFFRQQNVTVTIIDADGKYYI